MSDPEPAAGPFELASSQLAALPLIDRFLARIDIVGTLARHLPAGDARTSLSAATAIGVLVCNLCVAREPLYGLAGWAGAFEPGLLGARRACACTRTPVNAIDRLENREFLVGVALREVGPRTPGRKLVAKIDQWLAELDPDDPPVVAEDRAAREMRIEYDGWIVDNSSVGVALGDLRRDAAST